MRLVRDLIIGANQLGAARLDFDGALIDAPCEAAWS